MYNINGKTRKLANMGLMLAMAVVLSVLENMLPPIAALPPGVKLGLSNIITMYALFFLGNSPATTLAILKSMFVMLTRGPSAGFLSLLGGLASILSIIVLLSASRGKASYPLLSVMGAIFHNLGQLFGASLILGTNFVFAYLPVLIISGVAAGVATSMLLKAAMPLFDGIWNKRKRQTKRNIPNGRKNDKISQKS